MTLHANLIGRFGNQMFQYAFARAYALENNMGLTTNRWVGEEIFDLPNHSGKGEQLYPQGYHQDQASLIYTRKQVKEWFEFKPEVEEKLDWVPRIPIVAHRRTGDYKELGYVVVSEDSYLVAHRELGITDHFLMLNNESPFFVDGTPDFLCDFYTMMNAKILLRGNSTFSWWAATLGNSKVYSPVIDGLEGGKEQDCKFVEGNHPKFANLPMCTDLHLEEG